MLSDRREDAEMLDSLRGLFRKLGGADGERHFAEDDARLALAALLVHCTAIDGKMDHAERDKIEALLGRSFGLVGADLALLVDDAIAAEREAVDIYRFTSVLKRNLDEAARIKVVEDLWRMALADGKSHEFEENLIWRAAELLGVSRQDRIARKRAVAENKPLPQQDRS
jgi:uncharacterized tellurite resistance protein B-like protein